MSLQSKGLSRIFSSTTIWKHHFFCSQPSLGFPGGSDGNKICLRCGFRFDPGSIAGLWRSHGEWNGNPLQDSCLENSMNRGAWWATAHAAKSQTRLRTHMCVHTHTHVHSHTQVFVAALRISVMSCGIFLLLRTDSLVVAWGLSYSLECGILVPWPGIQPVSPALQGGFLTPGPRGKSQGLDTFVLASILCLALWGWDTN